MRLPLEIAKLVRRVRTTTMTWSLVKKRLAEINTSMTTPKDRVDHMDKFIEELKSKGDMKELQVEM